MDCPQCGSNETRRIAVIYEAETSSSHATGTFSGSGLSAGSYGGGGGGVTGVYGTTHSTTSTQSRRASRFSPPSRPTAWKRLGVVGIVFRSLVILVFGVFAAAFLAAALEADETLNAVISYILMGICCALLAWALISLIRGIQRNHLNRTAYPAMLAHYEAQLDRWRRTWSCNRCGAVYQAGS